MPHLSHPYAIVAVAALIVAFVWRAVVAARRRSTTQAERERVIGW
jgi:hypothetical protein